MNINEEIEIIKMNLSSGPEKYNNGNEKFTRRWQQHIWEGRRISKLDNNTVEMTESEEQREIL